MISTHFAHTLSIKFKNIECLISLMNLIALCVSNECHIVSILGKSNYDFQNGILSCEARKREQKCRAISCIVYFHLSPTKIVILIGPYSATYGYLSIHPLVHFLKVRVIGINHNEELTQNTCFTYKIFIILNPIHVAKPLQRRFASPLNLGLCLH